MYDPPRLPYDDPDILFLQHTHGARKVSHRISGTLSAAPQATFFAVALSVRSDLSAQSPRERQQRPRYAARAEVVRIGYTVEDQQERLTSEAIRSGRSFS